MMEYNPLKSTWELSLNLNTFESTIAQSAGAVEYTNCFSAEE